MKKTKNKTYPKKFIFALIFAFFSLLPAGAKEAGAWQGFVYEIFKQNLEIMRETINGIMLSAAKQQAIQALNEEINYLITGNSSSSAMYITDWKDYLVEQPAQEAKKIILNDYISQVTSGRGSISGYSSSSSSEGFGNYSSSLTQIAQNTVESYSATPTVTYSGDPSLMFENSTFKDMDSYLSGINNPWTFNDHVEQKYQEEKSKAEQVNFAKSIAGQGFLGKESNGITLTPGSLVKENVAKIQNAGIDVVTNATRVQEVITAVVTQMISKSIQQGIGSIQNSVHKEISEVRNDVTSEINSQIKNVGPEALFR